MLRRFAQRFWPLARCRYTSMSPPVAHASRCARQLLAPSGTVKSMKWVLASELGPGAKAWLLHMWVRLPQLRQVSQIAID